MSIDRRTFIISTAMSAGALASPSLLKGESSDLDPLSRNAVAPDFILPKGKPVLPQKDEKPEERRNQIDKRRPDYQFVHGSLAPLGLLKKLPDRSEFSNSYLSGRAKNFIPVVSNNLKVRTQQTFRRLKLKTLKDYEKFYPDLDTPASIANWQLDTIFAEQRLSGANPMVIRKVTDLEGLSGSIPGRKETWQQTMAEGKLFVCDYRGMPPIAGGINGKLRKYMPKPVAYFIVTKLTPADKGTLIPVAIRIAEGGPLLTPKTSSPDVWLYAKTCVQIADSNHHEMSTHLGRTHFVMEPFAVSAERHLADLHPLKVLLDEHFRFMLANNELGRNRLVNKGGIVDDLLAGTIEESLSIVKWAAKTYSVSGNALQKDLEDRGLADTGILPRSSYRDDALLLHAEMRRFITAYVALYYSNDSEVAADWELQAWVAEAGSPRGGGLAGVQVPLNTTESVVDLVTHILFTCSAQHAAVNYSQWDWMAFVPNMPLASYQKIAANGEGQNLMRVLPPAKQTREQVDTMATLTKYQYDKLGTYVSGTFVDARAADLANDFLKRLATVEQEIIERNKSRVVPYNFLRPSLVPNSISI